MTKELKLTKEEFMKKYSALELESLSYIDPTPFIDKYDESMYKSKSKAFATIVLIDGSLGRAPLSCVNEYALLMNANVLLHHKKGKIINFQNVIDSLGYNSDDRRGIAILGDGSVIEYSKRFQLIIEILNKYINHILLKEQGDISYPSDWFEIMKELKSYKGDKTHMSGDALASRCFASPREYIKVLDSNKTPKENAEKLILLYA